MDKSNTCFLRLDALEWQRDFEERAPKKPNDKRDSLARR